MKKKAFISLPEAKIYIVAYICEYSCFENIKDGNAIQPHITLKVNIYLYIKRSEVRGLRVEEFMKEDYRVETLNKKKYIFYIDVPVSFSL